MPNTVFDLVDPISEHLKLIKQRDEHKKGLDDMRNKRDQTLQEHRDKRQEIETKHQQDISNRMSLHKKKVTNQIKLEEQFHQKYQTKENKKKEKISKLDQKIDEIRYKKLTDMVPFGIAETSDKFVAILNIVKQQDAHIKELEEELSGRISCLEEDWRDRMDEVYEAKLRGNTKRFSKS